jgi:Zn-dependent peptidase ImmA (M78 family)
MEPSGVAFAAACGFARGGPRFRGIHRAKPQANINVDPNCWRAFAMLDDMPREDVLAAIDRMVVELLDAADVAQPPVDAIALAQRHLGMLVVIDQRQPQRGRAQRALGKKQIYLKPEAREERHQWTVAHEIGEHVKSELLERLGIAPHEARAMAGESLANLFSYRLLVPTRWFADDAKTFDYDLLALKKRYATSSHEVLAWRFLDLPAPCVVTILDNEKISRRRSNAWPTKRALLPVEEGCWRQVHESGEPQELRDGEWTVMCWPVHELDWKREILRSVRAE